ncbi:WD40 repeat-like protein [Glonium stellatum]|uniref:WD40 repeat-like protein n=1 Tax=Glonium stellatum TaxID=574774 RepID=A0A8E2FE08_9PEZI|nr:WD40 repeat-like protein [Glonium stellatum]
MAKRKREVVETAATRGTTKSRKQEIASTPRQTHRSSIQQQKALLSSNKIESTGLGVATNDGNKKPSPSLISLADNGTDTATVQIVTGSYERILHGFTAKIPRNPTPTSSGNTRQIEFADTFLFNAHSSAIRCIAISPPSASTDEHSQKVILASGSTDERINLYNLSTAPPPIGSKPPIPTLAGTTVSENPKNRELGSLLHHSSSITALYFPTRSKLLSSAEDNTIAISRTRDWTVLSTIKAPIPKPVGRPSGDTAAPGEVPAGVDDFAVHPSMKLMVSVGKGERCMRLWNLVTGKKAGVLNFQRDMLQQAGEGKWGTGEGRKVEWDMEGEEFVVAFEKGAVIFGMNSKPKARILPAPLTKLHQIRYVPGLGSSRILALSTEDGRILFYDTQTPTTPPTQSTNTKKAADIPACALLAQLGGRVAGITGRIKDFEILSPFSTESSPYGSLVIITGSSDGAVRLWELSVDELHEEKITENGDADSESNGTTAKAPKHVGQLIGACETGNRITCLKAFVMTGKPEDVEDEAELEAEIGLDNESSSDDSE